jgi:hypothetical protein
MKSLDGKSCEICYKSFWDDILEKCLTPLEPVDNAIFYRDDFNAEACKLGYGVSSNRKKCIKIDKSY